MSIKYEIHGIKNAKGEGKEQKYVHLFAREPQSDHALEDDIQASCSLTKADVRAAFSALARPHGACTCQRVALPPPRRGLLLALRRSRRSRRPALRQDARRLYPSAQHPLPSRALVARRGRQRCQLRACRLLLTFAPVHGGADPLAPPPLFRHPHLPHPPRPAARGRLAR